MFTALEHRSRCAQAKTHMSEELKPRGAEWAVNGPASARRRRSQMPSETCRRQFKLALKELERLRAKSQDAGAALMAHWRQHIVEG